jgi:hypothetical protein
VRTYTDMSQELHIKVGDRVCLTGKFLNSIGCYTREGGAGDVATVLEVPVVIGKSQTVYARVKWDQSDDPVSLVIAQNICRTNDSLRLGA